jgi:hypothetical protein
LTEAVRRTFKRRKTPVPVEPPIALTDRFWSDAGRAAHLNAFARRARLDVQSVTPADIVPLLTEFLLPVLDAVGKGEMLPARWKAGGPWVLAGSAPT